MANKKLLIVTSNSSQFRGFFRNKLKLIDKKIDIYLLIYPYGFHSPGVKKEIKNWTDLLKKKSVIKQAWYLDLYSYEKIRLNINFNINFLRMIKRIKQKNFDFFLVATQGHYWEKILVKYFNKKELIGYLLSPPSGMDYFNSLNDFFKSIQNKKFIFNNGEYVVKSDNDYFHQINSNQIVLKKNTNIINWILIKIKVRINLLINLIIMPKYLKLSSINYNNFFDKVNFSFNGVNKMIVFHSNISNLLKKTFFDKKIYFNNLINKRIKYSINNKWIYLNDNNNDKSVEVFCKIIINLKKINKINKIYIKQHPVWLSKKLDLNFEKKLKETKIPYEILNNYENVIYENYQGIILEPGSSVLESLFNIPQIKILCIKSNYLISSGAIIQFYKQFKEVCWKHDVKSLKKFLNKKKKFDGTNKKKNEMNEYFFK